MSKILGYGSDYFCLFFCFFYIVYSYMSAFSRWSWTVFWRGNWSIIKSPLLSTIGGLETRNLASHSRVQQMLELLIGEYAVPLKTSLKVSPCYWQSCWFYFSLMYKRTDDTSLSLSYTSWSYLQPGSLFVPVMYFNILFSVLSDLYFLCRDTGIK